MPVETNANMPQRVHIQWEMMVIEDDDAGSPEENSEGFWPSRDEASPGYVPPEKFDAAQAEAESIMEMWRTGKFYYVGVVAGATIHVPTGGNTFRVINLESAGVWGIEHDADEYQNEIFEQEKKGLSAELEIIAAALAAGDYVESTPWQG